MTKTLRAFQSEPAADCIFFVHPAASLQQGHLGWEVIGLDDLDRVTAPPKADVVLATVGSRSMQPESVHKTFDFLIHLGEALLQTRGTACVDANRHRGFTARKVMLDRV